MTTTRLGPKFTARLLKDGTLKLRQAGIVRNAVIWLDRKERRLLREFLVEHGPPPTPQPQAKAYP